MSNQIVLSGNKFYSPEKIEKFIEKKEDIK